MMKERLIATALCLGALATACKDKTDAPAQPEQTQAPTQTKAAPKPEAPAAQPTEADVRAQLLPPLASYPSVRLGEVQMDVTAGGEGEQIITARVQTIVGENLYTREQAPQMLNEERKAANEAMNLAMLPEVHYLLLVGASTEQITEADRAVKPLPEELQAQAAELKRLAESPVYHLHTTAETVVELPATMRAHQEGGRWEFTELNFDTAPLRSLVGTLPEGALPEGAPIVREGFEDQQRVALREKVEAFNEAAKPYIAGREAAARQRVLEAQAKQEEKERAAAEQAAARAACHEMWEKACADRIKDGATYTGEWKRGEAFGKLSLRMARVQRFADSIQFVGVIFDPDMPQAELQVTGRCEAPSSPKDAVPVTVHIYNGRYNPDIATAEVFDAQDGLLRLKMSEEGTLTGEMTCAAWAETPEKAFTLTLTFTAPKNTRRR